MKNGTFAYQCNRVNSLTATIKAKCEKGTERMHVDRSLWVCYLCCIIFKEPKLGMKASLSFICAYNADDFCMSLCGQGGVG